MSSLKFCIAGFGSIGRRHLRNLRELGQHDLILLRSNRSTLPDDEVRDVPVVSSIDDALAQRPDGIVIANPTALHVDIALPALKAGTAVLMEKPIDNTVDDALRLKDAGAALDSRFLMGFQYRFHPGLLKLRELLSDGAIGRVVSYRVDWGEYLPDWHPWEDYRNSYAARADLGGGVLRTLSHPLDYCAWLFGDVASVWGFNGKVSDLELAVDDLAEIGLRHESGIIGSIHLDYYRRVCRNDCEVVGTQGILRWRNDDGRVCLIRPNEDVTDFMPDDGFERNLLFLNEMKHFIDVTRGKAAPSCTFADGMRVMRLIEAVETAMKEESYVRL